MDLQPLLEASPAVQIHTAAAVGALAAGLAILPRRKGDRLHKMLGYAFVILMIVAAVSALFITGLMEALGREWAGWYSPIHLFVPLAFWGLFLAIRAVRAGDVARHRKEMRGLFLGALLIPGALAFLPGRTMWQVVFG